MCLIFIDTVFITLIKDLNVQFIRVRHGILYTSSASQNPHFMGFRKIYAIFCRIYHDIQCYKSLRSCKNAKLGLKQRFCVEYLQEIGFHTLSLRISTNPSTIWDKSSASYVCTLAKYSVSAGQH